MGGAARGKRQDVKEASRNLTGVVVFWLHCITRISAIKDYVSQYAPWPCPPIVVNMYQNVNDLLLLNLVKGVTSPERVVRAVQSGGFGCRCGFVLYCSVLLFARV